MKRPNEPREPAPDPLWDLLARCPPPEAGPGFARDVVRAARLEGPPEPAWRRWVAPRPIAAFAATAAAAAVAIVLLVGPKPSTSANPVAGAPATPEPATAVEPFGELQDLAEEELLLAAADHLGDFSDAELIDLLGF
jgi:hypothetical protein